MDGKAARLVRQRSLHSCQGQPVSTSEARLPLAFGFASCLSRTSGQAKTRHAAPLGAEDFVAGLLRFGYCCLVSLSDSLASARGWSAASGAASPEGGCTASCFTVGSACATSCASGCAGAAGFGSSTRTP